MDAFGKATMRLDLASTPLLASLLRAGASHSSQPEWSRTEELDGERMRQLIISEYKPRDCRYVSRRHFVSIEVLNGYWDSMSGHFDDETLDTFPRFYEGSR